MVRISDSLEDLVEILEHDEFALHSHFAPMNILEEPCRASDQFFLKPLVLYNIPDFAEHDFVRLI